MPWSGLGLALVMSAGINFFARDIGKVREGLGPKRFIGGKEVCVPLGRGETFAEVHDFEQL